MSPFISSNKCMNVITYIVGANLDTIKQCVGTVLRREFKESQKMHKHRKMRQWLYIF